MDIPPMRDPTGAVMNLWTGTGANSSVGTWAFYIKDSSGTAINITGWTVKLNLRADPDDTADLFTALSGTIPTGTDGLVTFDFSAVNISAEYTDAILQLYRVQSSNPQPLAQWRVDVLKNSGT